jgi:alpha-mannosidase
LPDDAFREVIYVNRYTFRFAAIDVPDFGYSVYYATNAKADASVMKHTENSAENDYISLKIEKNGSLTVTDKQTQKVYKGLNIYEDTPDIGDEYIFRAGEHTPITTENSTAKIILKEATSSYVTFGVSQEMLLPESYNRKLNCYSENKVPFTFETEITLNRFSRKIDVKVLMNNASDCHRIRALFKNDIKTDTVLANGQFDIVRRNIETDPAWKCPTNEQRIQSFVALKGEDTLLVATRGLYEYEVLRDGSNTLCINLLRSTDQLGDWGEFPTPDAQCKGYNTAEYEIFVGNADIYDDATILKWLKKFYWRFFSQQFKRSCLPDGPKVGSVDVSPRGGLRMPSDACATVWINELENLE